MIFALAAADTGVMQERVARPSSKTVQAPHWPSPQPYFVPVRSSRLRKMERRVSSAGALTLICVPLRFKTNSPIANSSNPKGPTFQVQDSAIRDLRTVDDIRARIDRLLLTIIFLFDRCMVLPANFG